MISKSLYIAYVCTADNDIFCSNDAYYYKYRNVIYYDNMLTSLINGRAYLTIKGKPRSIRWYIQTGSWCDE